MNGFIPFTKEGLEEIAKEKENLLRSRIEAVANLRTAREMGDLSENGAYHAARSRLSQTDSRLKYLGRLLKLGRVVDPPQDGRIGLGSQVTLEESEVQLTLRIVGTFEANPLKNKVSPDSPLGKVLFNKKEGDTAVVTVGESKKEYKILKVC